MSDEIKRIPADWAKSKGLTVIDPDGWRDDGVPWTAEITEAEFDRFVQTSTVMMDLKGKNDV